MKGIILVYPEMTVETNSLQPILSKGYYLGFLSTWSYSLSVGFIGLQEYTFWYRIQLTNYIVVFWLLKLKRDMDSNNMTGRCTSIEATSVCVCVCLQSV